MNNSVKAVCAVWIEPEIVTLDVDEAEALPGRGSDGSIFPDCTRS